MADELRELVATVDFDFDLGGLLSMNDEITEAEAHLRDLGLQIDRTGDLVGSLGRSGVNGLGGIQDAAGGASGGLDDIADAGSRAGDDIRRTGRRATRDLDRMGDAGRDAADGIRDASDEARDDLRDMGDAGRRAGEDIQDAAGEAERDLRDLGNSGERSAGDIADASRRAGDELGDLGDSGRRAGDDIEDAASRAERELRDLENSGERAGDSIRDASRRAGDGLQDISDQSRGAADDLEDMARRGQGGLDDLADAGEGSGGALRDAASEASSGFLEMIPGLSKVMEWLGKFKVSGVVAVGAVTAAVTIGLLAAIAKVADEMDVVNDRMSAMLGATTQETDDMRHAALNLYKDGFGESYASIGADISTIKGQFRDLNETELTKTAEKMSIIGDIWGKETGELTTATAVMTKTFQGLSKSDALDLITTGFQKAGPGGEDLLDTIGEYSVYFEKAGQGAQGFVGSLVKGMQAGARNTDVVADAFKEFGIMAVEVGGTAGPAMEQLGFDSKKMMADLAGGGPKAKAAFNAITAAISMVKDPLEMNTIGIATFGTKWEDLRDKIILSMNHGADAVEGFKGATDRAGNQLFDNFDSKWKQFTRTLKGTFMGMIDDSGFAESLTSMGQGLIDALPSIIAGINQFFDWLKSAFGSAGVDLGAMVESVKSAFSGLAEFLTVIWGVIGPVVTDTLSALFGTVTAILQGGFTLITDIFHIFSALFTGDWAGLWEATKSLFSNLWNSILSILKGVLNVFIAIWEGVFVRLWDFLAGVGIKIYQAGKDLLNGLINGVKELAPKVAEAVVGVANDMWEGFKSFFGINSPSRKMAEAGQWIIEGLKNGVMDRAKAAIEAVKNVAKEMWSGVKNFFGIASPSKLMIEAGGFVVEGMEVGISDTASQAVGAAKEMSKGIADAATKFGPKDAASAAKEGTASVASSKVVDMASYKGAKAAQAAKDSPEVAAMTKKPDKRVGGAEVLPMAQQQTAPAADSRPYIHIAQITIPVTIQGGAGGATVDEEAIKEGARVAAMKGFNAALEEYFRSLNTAIGE